MPNSVYDQLFDLVGQNTNVDPQLAKTVFHIESSGNPNTPDSEVGAQGPMQLMPPLQKHYGVTDPHKMEQAVPAAMAYLREGLDKTGTPAGALAYYFSGSANPADWGPKTQAYIAKGERLYPTMALSLQSASTGTQPMAQQTPDDPYLAFGRKIAGSDASAAPAAQSDPYLELGRSIEEQNAPTSPASSAPAAAAPPPAEPAAQGPMLGIPALQNFTEGTTQGIRDVGNTLERGIGYVDQALPMLGRLDQAVGIDPAAAQANLLARRQVFEASPAGQSLAGGAGRLVGQLATTAPVVGPLGSAIGAGGNLLVQGAGRISPFLGEFGGAVSDLIGGTATVPGGGIGNALVRGISTGTQGAVQGAGFAGATSGQSDAPIGQQMAQGGLSGAVAGPALGALGSAGGAAGRLVSGGDLTAARARLADLAVNKYGLPLTLDQVSQNPLTKKAGQMLRQLPMTGMGSADLQAGIDREIAKTFGADLTKSDGVFTPAVMQDAKDRLGSILDGIAQRTTIVPTNQFLADIGNVVADAKKVLNPEDFGKIKKAVSDIRDVVQNNNGVIPGDAYQSLTRSNRPLDRLASSLDPDISFYARGVRDALDDAFQASAAPGDQALLSQTRLQYKNMMTVAPLVAKSANGQISPALLNSRVSANFKNRAFSGADDLGEIAQIGQAFVKPPADSGTPLGTAVLRALENPLSAGVGIGSAGGLGALAGISPLTAAGAAGTYGAALATQRMLASHLQNPAVVNRLIQSGLAPVSPSIVNRLGSVAGQQLLPASVLIEQRRLGAGGTPP